MWICSRNEALRSLCAACPGNRPIPTYIAAHSAHSAATARRPINCRLSTSTCLQCPHARATSIGRPGPRCWRKRAHERQRGPTSPPPRTALRSSAVPPGPCPGHPEPRACSCGKPDRGQAAHQGPASPGRAPGSATSRPAGLHVCRDATAQSWHSAARAPPPPASRSRSSREVRRAPVRSSRATGCARMRTMVRYWIPARERRSI
mmetsp:Transcript_125654/g.268136  ORF Transcript_125654/g.268136 Transcript_125654/m.268136 type:complete len:205 (+) Transcript_125654:58-672(+)